MVANFNMIKTAESAKQEKKAQTQLMREQMWSGLGKPAVYRIPFSCKKEE